MTLWNKDTEIQFFIKALKNFASPEISQEYILLAEKRLKPILEKNILKF